MPILDREDDMWPADLLDVAEGGAGDPTRRWYCAYTLSRREKELVRRLIARQTPCLCPLVPQRRRSPAGRLRTSWVPLFAGYVFLLANDDERRGGLETGCVSRMQEIVDRERLVADLRPIVSAVRQGVPLTPESRLGPGNRVRVTSGPFRDYEGEVLRREGKTRLLLRLNFLEQGASMEMDEGVLKPI